jgi:hypothetical protein
LARLAAPANSVFVLAPKAAALARTNTELWRIHSAFDLPSERFGWFAWTDEKGGALFALSLSPFGRKALGTKQTCGDWPTLAFRDSLSGLGSQARSRRANLLVPPFIAACLVYKRAAHRCAASA